MELGSIVQFLDNKTILVTGATGFLAKILAEKILRTQPNIKKLFLLLRAGDAKSAAQRLQNEVTGKDVFGVLREKWGSNFKSFISEKVTAVPGDITCSQNLGIKDTTLIKDMYDVALGINTLGAKHVMDFAKKCANVKLLLHVSTAYVWGEKEGVILEKPLYMGETLNGVSGLDIGEERKVVEEELNDLRGKGVTDEKSIATAMKDLGLQRARKYGWPNTYVFTKSMGEMLLGHFKEDLPLVILRPTVITSTYKEPFPGWVEGFRTIDSLAVGYGKGKITCFLCDPECIIDVIPADMVVNAVIASMAAHAGQPSDIIYQSGLFCKRLDDFAYKYFTKNPWINNEGKPVKVERVTVLTSMDSFHRYFAVRFLLPLEGLKLANIVFCQYFRDKYDNLNGKIKLALRLIELYGPYLFLKAVFDDMNTERLRMAVREGGTEVDLFYFDPKSINWEEYFLKTHLPAVVKYLLK
ncbi:Fatty acyl-coenzyme A reductase, NAD-binding domain [Dillenia turbinata]|uniref:Fatty acyl-CoA reductase n=1 Tax=Dillenia turbinata TaxID=194707 RepID=A0AAN8V4R0_9MAGN